MIELSTDVAPATHALLAASTLSPGVILAIGIALVLFLMLVVRLHAFVALITAAMVVSLLSPGEMSELLPRAAAAFGSTAAGVGIVIAMAAIVGSCMMASGAADRVVQAMLAFFGEKRAGVALTASGFFLSAPVFFDTVFYLLAPLARSLFTQTKRDYLKYLMAICAGGVVTHTLVPPTPGPLAAAEAFQVDFGLMMLVGTVIGVPMAAVGLAFSSLCNRLMPVEMQPLSDTAELAEEQATSLPSLAASLAPVLIPVAMIVARSIIEPLAASAEAAADPAAGGGLLSTLAVYAPIYGDKNLALVIAAGVAYLVYLRQRRPSRQEATRVVEESLASGAVIVLITAAGGAFGAMLAEAGVGDAISARFTSGSGNLAESGAMLLALGFGVSVLFKFSQGSSTVAMTTTSAMMATMLTKSLGEQGLASLSFHPVYLATAIGCGSLVGSWMNDSGFWIYCKMGGLTEVQSLKTWTPLLAIMGVVGFVTTLLMAMALPLQ